LILSKRLSSAFSISWVIEGLLAEYRVQDNSQGCFEYSSFEYKYEYEYSTHEHITA